MREFMAITKALADENRTRVLMFLRGGELCVCQVMEMLGLAPSTVSKHLNILHQAGLVESRKEGRWIYYRLPDRDAPPVVRTAVEWVRRSLARDPRIVEDARRLKTVREMSKDDLCCRYKA
jgi:DNA-binding transcriptional ArsR family regulator